MNKMALYLTICVEMIFVSLAVPARAADEPALTLAGVGVVMASSPYRGADSRVMPVPMLRVMHKDFYIKGIEAGYHFLKHDAWAFSALVSPRFMGYEASDSAALSGMADRRWSLDAGLKAEYALPWEGMGVTAKAVGDVLARSHGSEYELSIEQKFKSRIFRFTPSAGVKYQTSDLVDYYYGVRDTEAAAGRPAYAPSGMFVPFANALFTFGISPRWIIMTRAGIDFLGAEARKSPIVDERRVMSAAAGLTYRF